MDRKAEYERIEREREAAEREARRTTLRALLGASLQCIGFCALGLFIMFFAFHVHDLFIGRAFLYGGMAVGYAGLFYTVISAYKRGVERGDWE